ncbi:MAG TPA: orotidine-5'-phosphate decarboxylase [Candidatus Manganitrophaceae bacterium]|nr:orotidine-5'-phosphate decarboxylase [Candidatus Manganitrophaceae bacterium]
MPLSERPAEHSAEHPVDRLILALDLPDPKEALRRVDELAGLIRIFKVGSTLYTASGPPLIQEIKKRGGEVFLDLKFHDIPNTVAGATLQAARQGVRMMTLHTLGGREMIRKGVEAVREASGRGEILPPLLIGVTVLTSLDQAQLKETMKTSLTLEAMVLHLANLAREEGLDGVVASPRELVSLRKRLLPPFRLVTPGIRLDSDSSDDQKRFGTPRQAIYDGADYLVVGRPILESKDKIKTVQAILSEIKEAG